MNSIKFCLKCGHPVGPDDKFCLGCGANLAEMQAQQGAGAVAGAAQQVQNAAENVQNNFQQPQQNAFQNDAFQQPQQVTYAQPAAGFGAPGAAVKKGDSWVAKNLKMIIIVAAALVVAIVAFFVIKHVFFRFQKIDAKDLIKVEFKGIETSGVATAKLNKYSDSEYAAGELADSFSDMLGGYDFGDEDASSDTGVSKYFEISKKKLMDAYTKAGDEKEAKKMRDALRSERAGLSILINGDENSAKGLSNGDKVTIKLLYNEEYLKENNIKIENAEYEVTVEGLKSGTRVDMFSGVTLNFKGNDGSGTATITKDDNVPSFIRYTFKETYRNLKNGDKVVVIARIRGAQLVDNSDPEGAVWLEYDGNYYTSEKESIEKEFTVEGLTELKKIDVFENIELKYNYAIPYLRATGVNNEKCSEEVKNGVRFYLVESGKDLKVGDTVKVRAYVRSTFTDAGYAPEGTPDEDGYYYKEFVVDENAPTYLTKANASAAVDKFKSAFDEQIKKTTDEAVDRTYVAGFSAGAKVTGLSFKEEKTMLFENNDATAYSSVKCYLVKQYVVTITTEKETKTAYALIRVRNPIVKGSEVSNDSVYSVNLYASMEYLDKNLESTEKSYTISEIGGAAPAETTAAADEKPDETAAADEKKPEETTAAAA